LAQAENGTERELALECRRLAERAERDARVFRQLQGIYDTVAQAPDASAPEDIRGSCCDEFRRLYALTDYRIEGWENLPSEPGFVVVMNHLSNHPENTLPNEFQLTLDTHFVSAMILYERYGSAPVRVVRQAEPDEEGHRRYFDRLGYITVTSGSATSAARQTPSDLERVREQFLNDARTVLASHQNLVICPEGGSTKTESSPMPFRAGAFRVVRNTEPEPLMVPIAVANFDKQIARTRLAAKIFPPLRLSDAVSPAAPDEVLYEFINRFRDRYRDFVRQAVQLTA
jgi:1-acyl-sn-glycerol-3-phosphate acyltransferase